MKFRSVAHYNGGDTVTALQKRTAHCAFCLMPTPTAALEACVMIFKWMEVRMRMCMCMCVYMIFLCQDVRRTHVQTVAAPRLVQTDAPTAALDMHMHMPMPMHMPMHMHTHMHRPTRQRLPSTPCA